MKRLVKFVSVIGVVVMLSLMVGMNVGTARAKDEYGPRTCMRVRWGEWDGTYKVTTFNGSSYVTVTENYQTPGGTLSLSGFSQTTYKVRWNGGFPLYEGATLYVDIPYFVDSEDPYLDLNRSGVWQLKDQRGIKVASGNFVYRCP